MSCGLRILWGTARSRLRALALAGLLIAVQAIGAQGTIANPRGGSTALRGKPLRVDSVRPFLPKPGERIRIFLSRPPVLPAAGGTDSLLVMVDFLDSRPDSTRGRVLFMSLPKRVQLGEVKILVREGTVAGDTARFEVADRLYAKVAPVGLLLRGQDRRSGQRGDTVMLAMARPLDARTVTATYGVDSAAVARVSAESVWVELPNQAVGDGNRLIQVREEETTVAYARIELVTPWYDPSQPWVKAMFVLVVIGIVGYGLFNDSRRRAAESRLAIEVTDRRAAVVAAVGEDLPAPQVPFDLVEACAKGDAVLYAGAGVSVEAGFPVWRDFVPRLLRWSIGAGHVDAALGGSLYAALDAGQLNSVADTVTSVATPVDLHEFLKAEFGRDAKPTSLEQRLKLIGFSAVLTTNFDRTIDSTFGGRTPAQTPDDCPAMRKALLDRAFFLLKLYGTLDRPESILLSPAQFSGAVSRNRAFQEFMEGMLSTRTLFFVGASMAGIQVYFDGLGLRNPPSRKHYALVDVTDRTWRVQAGHLLRRYNIEVLPYIADGTYSGANAFVESLAISVAQAKLAMTGVTSTEAPRLARVELSNIGAFESLALDLDPEWNIILGDNGVGKSTILKAIALAFAGKDGQPLASRLLKSGSTAGQIKLVASDGQVFEVEILSRGPDSEPELYSRGFDLVGVRWLAVGFSPIRSVTWDRPKGPTPDGSGTPVAGDVLPLVRGESDARMNQVKQWLLNLDYRVKDEENAGTNDGPAARLRADFIRVVGELLSGLTLELLPIDPKRGVVMVRTDDGPVPIEALSQGTASLLGWIGVLLQRLSEVFGAQASDSYAVVLVDEIDAHMHPAWQQQLVKKLSKLFPKVQFIATTHSPLIAGGLPPAQLTRFVRSSDRKVVRAPLDDDASLGRADQVLNGDLFSLQPHFDSETMEAITRYKDAVRKLKPGAPIPPYVREMERQVAARIPSADTDLAERRVADLVTSILSEQLEPGDKAHSLVLDRARKAVHAVIRPPGLS
jgi:energy-coupling factor transporter ATP-binding protein EcfA2